MKKVKQVNGLTIWQRSSREMQECDQQEYAIFLPDDRPSTADPDWDADTIEEATSWCECYTASDDIDEDQFDPEKPCLNTHECDPDCPYLGTDMCSEDDI
jgi:hypothetical protein